MADAISRTTDSVWLPYHSACRWAYPRPGEAYLDGIPMLVIAGGIRRDSGKHYQLHQLDMKPIAQGVTLKATIFNRKPRNHSIYHLRSLSNSY
ncbi:MAG: hypothetical protein R2836_01225 [Chitinophagales bacterium]